MKQIPCLASNSESFTFRRNYIITLRFQNPGAVQNKSLSGLATETSEVNRTPSGVSRTSGVFFLKWAE